MNVYAFDTTQVAVDRPPRWTATSSPSELVWAG